MKKKYILLLAALLLTTLTVSAQRRLKKPVAEAEIETPQVVNNYLDSLNTMRQRLDSLQQVNDQLRSEQNDGRYFRLFAPTTFYHSGAQKSLSLKPQTGDDVADAIDQALMNVYLRRPDLVVNNESNLQAAGSIREDVNQELTQEVELTDFAAPVPDEPEAVPIQIVVQKPNFWKFTGQASLQFTQNYFSDNWYKGGNNNQNLLASLILQANYDDQKRLSWENKLEMRLGFMTTPSDTCHKFLTSNDKLNLYSKLGLKAKKAWFYTATAEANTQFMPGYRSNNRLKFSNFLAPFDVYFSIGMDFKPSLKNGNTFSLALLPFSYKMRWLNDKDDNIHRVYNMVDEDITHDFGSKLEMNCKFQIAKDFFWKSRLYCYSAYDYVEAEWENSFTYAFSKYINAEVFTLWRFDDNRDRKYYDEHLGYFQFKEYFTLGLTYAF